MVKAPDDDDVPLQPMAQSSKQRMLEEHDSLIRLVGKEDRLRERHTCEERVDLLLRFRVQEAALTLGQR